MKILVSSHSFAPTLGGVEELSELCAVEFAALGHEVKLVTRTPHDKPDNFPFEVVRQPTPGQLMACVRWCDAYLQMNLSFALAWPLLLTPRPWVVGNQMSLLSATKSDRYREWLTRVVLHLARVTVPAKAVLPGTPPGTTVVTNPYRNTIFRVLPGEHRPNDLVFVGRLVSVKGVSYLLDALATLRGRELTPNLTIIGDGSDEARLRGLCTGHNLNSQVTWAGSMANGEEMAQALNRAKIMVVPSMWEGLPLVVLQGVACGCALVASDANGTPEGVGPCGLVFPKGNSDAMADCLETLLRDDSKRLALRAHREEHLARHQPRAVAEAYLAVIEETRRRRGRGGRVQDAAKLTPSPQ